MTETRVLLVEDNRADARLVAELLSEVPNRPFTLTSVGTLSDALAEIPSHDVVLLDLSLPDAHGLVTVERMVDAARTRPIVVLTGNDDERVAMDALHAGAEDYLLKSEMTPSLVARSIRYAVERKRVEAVEVARAKSEQTAQRAKFLARVAAEVTRTLHVDAAMAGLAQQVLPLLGDLVVVDLVRENGAVERVACAATTEEWCAAVTGNPSDDERSRAVLRLVAGGSAVHIADGPGEGEDLATRRICERLRARSLLITPLVARDSVIGAVSYAFVGSQRQYDDDDEQLASEIATHAALAVDNAALFQKAQQAIRARDGLLAVVSHDLRNPLEVLSLSLSLLSATATGGQNGILTRARRALDRMTRLITDLLDIARIDAGTLPVNPEPLQLGEVLDEAFELHRPLAAEKRITLTRQFTKDLGTALVDRHRMLQVLSNLLGNALKFTPEGGSIVLGAEQDPPFTTIYVKDSGSGISPENLNRVFDRFWQKERNAQGVGLGLAIVKGIVEAHGGNIGVESAPGAGTTFHFRLRRIDAGSGENHTSQRTELAL